MARARSSPRYTTSDLENIRIGQRWMIFSFLGTLILPVLALGCVLGTWALADVAIDQNILEGDQGMGVWIWIIVVLILGAFALDLILMILHVIGIIRMLVGMKVSGLAYLLCLLLWLPIVWYSFKANGILQEHGYKVGLLGARAKQT